MSVWQRWMRRPQGMFWRRACFQVHLWIGIAVGVYIVLLSVTGSALVFRRELDRAFRPQAPPLDASRSLMSKEELSELAAKAYPGATVQRVGGPQRRTALVRVVLERNGETLEREFNAYTGEDLGEPWPWKAQLLLRLADLHDDLLLLEDRRGRFWNGVGSVLVTVLCLTGAVIWWPGIRGWRRALRVKWDARWPRLNFDLHSAMGFWFFVIIAIWSISGIYLAFPSPFTTAVDKIWGVPETLAARPGDVVLEWLVRLHFGRWRSHTLKVVWVILGLIPTAMFVTGFAMWWHRVVRRRRTVVERRPQVVTLAAEPQGIEWAGESGQS